MELNDTKQRYTNSQENAELLNNSSNEKVTTSQNSQILASSGDKGPIGGIKYGPLVGMITIACLPPIQFGFLNGYWNGMQYPFRAIYEWETKDDFDSWSGIIQACNVLGGLTGVFATAPILPWGRWKGLLIANLVIILGSLISMVEKEAALVIGRTIYGIGVGIISVLGPKFLNEILPLELRGPLGTIYQLFVVSGIFVSYLLCLFMPINYPDGDDTVWKKGDPIFDEYSDQWLVQSYWRYYFSIPTAVSIIHILFMFTSANFDSPNIMKKNGETQKLRDFMKRIYVDDVIEARIAEIEVEDEDANKQQVSFYDVMFNPQYRKATYIGIFLGCAQQLCGINVMFGYSGRIFNDMHLSSINSYQGSAIIGFFNTIAVFFTGKMLVSYGRKTLMVVFEIGMGICLIGMGISSDYAQDDGPVVWNYIKLVCIIFFVIFFEFSAGPIVWLYNAEIMQDKALTVATGFNWISCMMVGLFCPTLLSHFPVGIYYGFASITLLSAFIESIFMKETKGLSEEQLSKLYSK